jgi:hypothetical protein
MRAESAVFIPFVLQTQDSRTVCAKLTPESPGIAQHHLRCSPNFGPAASTPRHLPRRNAPQHQHHSILITLNRGQTTSIAVQPGSDPRAPLMPAWTRGQTRCAPRCARCTSFNIRTVVTQSVPYLCRPVSWISQTGTTVLRPHTRRCQ